MAESSTARRKKIAILGGGTGALAAAFGLTERPGWRDEYEITVYQMGWRLGGKGASGRNAGINQRIEEHGLHVWSGFYENAFRIMRACYEEMDRPPGAPLATVEDAFKPQNFVTFTEFIDGDWKDWNLNFPMNNSPVGMGELLPSVWDYVTMTIDWMADVFLKSPHSRTDIDAPAGRWHVFPEWLTRFTQSVETFAEVTIGSFLVRGMTFTKVTTTTTTTTISVEDDIPGVGLGLGVGGTPPPPFGHVAEASLLGSALSLARSVPSEAELHPAAVHHGILWLLRRFHEWLTATLSDHLTVDDHARRVWLFMDFCVAMINGLVSDGVILHGFDWIDDMEWGDWLRKHGASEDTIQAPQVRAMYDYIFAFVGGDTTKPSVAAGTITRCLLRLSLTYKTAVFMKMQAGMGDTVFTPMYLALEKRGVRFEFFQKVRDLHLSDDGRRIAAITVDRQVDLKDGAYDPLVDVDGLPCWPSTPLYDQIVQGVELREKGIDLESAWSPWRDVGTRVLRVDEDFDEVVLGISLAALPGCCGELIAAREPWRVMTEGVKTVQTLAMQVWLKPDLAGLGWTESTILSGYAQPFDTWCDMSQVLDRETWPDGCKPGNISYFCGPKKDPEVIPGPEDHLFPSREKDLIKRTSIAFLDRFAAPLWANSTDPHDPDKFRWSILEAPADVEGVTRFDSQYWRANVNPADRYVISLPGTTKLRLKADQSGFENLFLAGDWVRNGLNYGCVESAVMGGLQAARAMCGYPEVIVGETD